MTDQFDHSSRSSSTQHAFHGLVLMGLLSLLGILFALAFHLNQEVSEVENRRLASWPKMSTEALFDGSYATEIENYVSDHFPARSWFTEAAFAIQQYRGLHRNDRVIKVKGAETGFEDVSTWASSDETIEPEPQTIDKTTPLIASQPSSVTESATSAPLSLTQSADLSDIAVPTEHMTVTESAGSLRKLELTEHPLAIEKSLVEEKPVVIEAPVVIEESVEPKKPIAEKPIVATVKPTFNPPVIPNVPVQQTQALKVVGGVLLHDGQALFMFQGTDRGAQGYANAVNTWVELVANKYPGMTSTVVVTPTSSHFYLPPAARARTTSEAKNLAAMRAALLPEVRFADVISEMKGYIDEALFFKSDHHWTGLGAYYAYRAWAKAAGVSPLELSAFDKRSVPGVAGSFWSLTQAPELRNIDKQSFYYVPTTVTFDGTQYAGPQQKTPVAQSFFAEKSRGYIVFLGGDIPLLVSNTSAGTGRTALVVKNSYGNAFAPYLLPHFDRVVVLDYRYVSRNIQDIVNTFGVTDLIFVNATITANSGAHQERMRQVARGSSTAWLTEPEKRRIKQQQEAAAANAQSSTSTSDSAQ